MTRHFINYTIYGTDLNNYALTYLSRGRFSFGGRLKSRSYSSTVFYSNDVMNLYPSSLHLHSHTHLPRQFLQQYHHYQSLLQLFLINPSQQSSRLKELLMFLSQVTRSLYTSQLTDYQISYKPLIQTVIHL